MTDHGNTSRLAFGPFVLDLDRVALFREGADLGLRPKTFDVLRCLALQAGTLVSKQELMDAVWGRTVVTEDSLTQCVVEIRRAMGRRHRDLVRTVPRRGYLLNTEVLPEAAVQAITVLSEPLARRRWTVVSLVVFTLTIVVGFTWFAVPDPQQSKAPQLLEQMPVLAVLPFEDMTRQRDHAWFGDGLAEEILNRLAQSDDLLIIARTSSFALRQVDLDLPSVAMRLGASHVLEGSVRNDGSELRITAQLIEATNGTHLWSRTFDSGGEGNFVTQELIANAVAEELHAKLAWQQPAVPTPQQQEAYAANLQGRYFYNRRQPGDLELALAHYQQATELDPELAAAWAGLSATEGLMALESSQPTAGMLRSREAAERAYHLDPTNPEVLLRTARAHWYLGEADQARGFMELAYEFGEGNPLILGIKAGHQLEFGNFEESIRLFEQALHLDPLNQVLMINYTIALLAEGQFDRASAQAKLSLDIYPQSDGLSLLLGKARLGQGQPREALKLFTTLEPGPIVWLGEALALQALGKTGQARERLRRIEHLGSAAAQIYKAQFLAMTGSPEEALRLLQQAFSEPRPPGPSYQDHRLWNEVLSSEWLIPVRELPEWSAGATELRLWLSRPGMATETQLASTRD